MTFTSLIFNVDKNFQGTHGRQVLGLLSVHDKRGKEAPSPFPLGGYTYYPDYSMPLLHFMHLTNALLILARPLELAVPLELLITVDGSRGNRSLLLQLSKITNSPDYKIFLSRTS